MANRSKPLIRFFQYFLIVALTGISLTVLSCRKIPVERVYFSDIVDEAILNKQPLARFDARQNHLVVQQDSLFILLSVLRELPDRYARKLDSVNTLPKGEFEKTIQWETRIFNLQEALVDEIHDELSVLCGARLDEGIDFVVRARVDSSFFSYNPDKVKMDVASKCSMFHVRDQRNIFFYQLIQTMYDFVTYGREMEKNKNNIFVNNIMVTQPSGERIVKFRLDFTGSSFPPAVAPQFKKLVNDGEVIAEVYFRLKFDYQLLKRPIGYIYQISNDAITSEINKVVFTRPDGAELLTWDSVIKYKTYVTGPQAYREIKVSHNANAL